MFCTDGSIRLDNFLLPAEMTVIRGIGEDKEEETLVTQWPGGGYTFEIGEVNRCLRAGELESPLVPWRDTLAVARTLDRWLLSVFPPVDPELGTEACSHRPPPVALAGILLAWRNR